MTTAKFIVIALVVAGSAGAARAADSNGIELELCIQTARDADATCAKLTDNPAQRLECFRRARGAQLDCLEHALAEISPGTVMSADHSGISQFEPPASTGSTDALSQQKSQGDSQANAQETSRESSNASQETAADSERRSAASMAQAAPEAAPAPTPATTPAAESTTTSVPSDPPKDTPKEAPKEEVKEAHKTDEAQAKPRAKLSESNWVVSETTSPVDYGPLLTAVIRPTSNSPGGPVSLAIRCRGGQTGLLIRTERTWHATRRNAIPVDFQINDQPTVRQNWILSADAKIANYADDAVELLRSLPDGARLTVSVTDGAEQATFLLAGWDAIRKRVETACKWSKATDEASSGKR
jgi:Type VI secretion system VasI, EvfG, VC_A0118